MHSYGILFPPFKTYIDTMILSMTGFGRGTASSSSKRVTVELKSLNSKQFDLMMRVPACYRELEVETRNSLAQILERGKVELSAFTELIGVEAPMKLNIDVIAAYKAQLEDLALKLDIPEPSDWYATLLRLPDTLKADNEAIDPQDVIAFTDAVKMAAEALRDFRISEGRKLYAFFVSKIENIKQLLLQIDPFEQERVVKIKERLTDQLSRLTSIEYDAGRLEQELIFYIEKLDVTEEKTRLTAHLNYFLETMGNADESMPQQGQGKKLGFIAQEMGREINTLGSKSNHAEMQKIVVKMKDELEQIKEQVLNVL